MQGRALTRIYVDQEERHLSAEIATLEANRTALTAASLLVPKDLEHCVPSTLWPLQSSPQPSPCRVCSGRHKVSLIFPLSGELPRSCHAQDDGHGHRKHHRRHRFVQKGGGQRQTEEGLQALQLAHRGDAALRQAALPEDESDQHAEQERKN